MGGVDLPQELIFTSSTSLSGAFAIGTTTGGGGRGFFPPFPGLAFRWGRLAADPAGLEGDGSVGHRVRVMMRDPHATNRPPTQQEWLRSVVQQVFLAVFFAMFVAITFGG
ncbi:hypothetical protein JCM3774_003593 [Rhodotorula dairenensis]